MPTPITHYRLAWHPGVNEGRAIIRLQSGDEKNVPINSPAELSALAAVLREKPVFLEEDGYIYTGWEAPEK